jgi:hypothetical protein
VDELNLAVILVVPPPARAALQAANDHVDRPLGILEWGIWISYLREGRQVALPATVLRLTAVTSPVVAAIVVLAATLVVVVVVVVAT